MSNFIMRPRIGSPRPGELSDTAQACAERQRVSVYKYVHGDARPNFSPPAIVCKIVWFPEGSPFMRIPLPYVNWLRYNGMQGKYGVGYEAVYRIYVS